MKPRICFCIDSLKIGGAEKLLVDIINNWNLDTDVYLCTLNPENDFMERINWAKIKKYNYFSSGSRRNIIKQAAMFCQKNSIQIVNTHLEHSNKCFGLGAAIAGASVITTIHSINIYSREPFIRRCLVRTFYNIVPKSIIAV